MPITTYEDGVEVRFGHGDVMIIDTKPKGTEAYTGLGFFQTESREIGAITQEYAGKGLSEVEAKVHLVFEKKESVKALIDSLNEIYDNFPDN